MATFKLKDGFGLDANITPNSDALLNYFKPLPNFQVSGMNLSKPPVTRVEGGLDFSEPINLVGSGGVELTVAASASGKLSIFVPPSKGGPLFSPDKFGDNIAVDKDQRYVSMGLSAQLSGSASVSTGDLKFGFDGKAKVNLAYYQRFAANAPFPKAVEDTIANFSIPGDLDDIAGMPANSIATVDSSGELKFSGKINLLTAANPLATATLPASLGSVAVSGPVAIDVGAQYTFSGDYQIRIRRLAGKKFRIGFYRERDSAFSLTAEAKASLSAKFGDNDLFVKVMQAISSDATADLKQLEAAGLSEDQAKAIQSAVKSAVDRSLAIGASLELSRADESDAIFLYEVDLGAVQPTGRAMLHSALDGDLTKLVQASSDLDAPVPGITVKKTLVSTKKTFQHTFKLNLLGIYNVLQVSRLIIEGKTAWDADTGVMVLTDEVTADKIQVVASNLQAKNPDKLQQLLAEHFLITAGYRAVKNVVSGPPELSATQTYFDLQKNPGKVRMRDYLLISVALGLQSAQVAKSQLPASVDDFGATTVYAEAGYDDKAFRSLFFDDKGALLSPATYSDAGRSAIANLVQKGDDDDYRLALATDRKMFDDLVKIGNVQYGDFARRCVKAGVPQATVPVVATDFLDIVWFTHAMVDASKKLQAVDNFLRSNPNVDPENNAFKKLKQELAKKLGEVADNATVHFGGPWGFETMALLGKASSKKWMLVNKFVTRELSVGQPKAAALAAKTSTP